MRQKTALIAFNRGIVSRLGLARTDIKRVAFAAETFTDFIPRRLGSMMIRPGLKYIGATKGNNAARFIPFVFATTDTALIEFTNTVMRVWINDALVTRGSVASVVTNGTFATDATGWTDSDEAGGTSAWVTGGYLGLTGNGTAGAIRDQQVTVASADRNVEHALRIVIQRGPVTLRVGSTSGGDEYIRETSLGTGTHSLAFTPTGNFYIRFMCRLKRQVLVDSCAVEASGVMEITSPYLTADLDKIVGGAESQSADVIYLACDGYQQRKIERRATRSWSLVLYQPEDGPFQLINSGPTTIASSALSGNVTLTASAALFRSTHVGALFEIISSGQVVSTSVTGANQFTNAILVKGVGAGQRTFTITRSGTWVATVTLQRSLTSNSGPWEDVTTYTTNATITFNDGLDNQDVYYRIGVKTGDYTSGTVSLELRYNSGSTNGIVRITDYTSATSVGAEVIVDLGGTAATDDWLEGEWSPFRGWPTAVAFFEGRLWWAGRNGIWGSVSDAFESFNENTVGDSGTISRTIGSGPVDVINWIMPLEHLLLGAQGSEHSVRASSLDEILTPTNFNIRPVSNQGSHGVQAVKIDTRAAFVQRGGTRLFEMSFDNSTYDYTSNDLTLMAPEIGQPGIVRMGVQRQPETRVHCVRSDGKVALLIYDPIENLICWNEVTSTGASGLIEDVCILPGGTGDDEDQVYYVVKRTINGATVRYLEKWALESQCKGDQQLCRLADSFVTYSGAATTVITGLTNLEGANVVVWADGADVGTVDAADGSVTYTYTISGGQITLATAASNVVVGLPYTAQWMSGKLLQLQTQLGAELTTQKNIRGLGLVMANVHPKGLQFGPDFTHLDTLPGVENGAEISSSTMRASYEETVFPFPGTWDADSRIALQARAPRPVTVLAAVVDVDVVE